MAKKNQKHIVDKWTADWIGRFPKALDLADAFYANRDAEDLRPMWPDWCGLPMAAVYAIVSGGASSEAAARTILFQEGPNVLPCMAAALNWVRGKAVYKFDPDLAALLLEQPLDDKLPKESLFTLPHYCVYIEYPLPIFDKKALGVFAWMEMDKSLVPELRLLYLMPDMSALSIPIILTGGTIDDSARALAGSAAERMGLKDLPFVVDRLSTYALPDHKQICGAINMVLYLCSTERDIPDGDLRRPTDHRGNPKRMRSWDVGVRVGNAWRRYKSAVEEHVGGTHDSPRPHIRRAHWHHFWVGPRDSAERKLVIKWLPPIPVNYDAGEDLPTVLQFIGLNEDK